MWCDILAYTVSTYVYNNVYLRSFTYTEIRNTTGVFVAVVKSGFLFELEFDWWLFLFWFLKIEKKGITALAGSWALGKKKRKYIILSSIGSDSFPSAVENYLVLASETATYFWANLLLTKMCRFL